MSEQTEPSVLEQVQPEELPPDVAAAADRVVSAAHKTLNGLASIAEAARANAGDDNERFTRLVAGALVRVQQVGGFKAAARGLDGRLTPTALVVFEGLLTLYPPEDRLWPLANDALALMGHAVKAGGFLALLDTTPPEAAELLQRLIAAGRAEATASESGGSWLAQLLRGAGLQSGARKAEPEPAEPGPPGEAN